MERPYARAQTDLHWPSSDVRFFTFFFFFVDINRPGRPRQGRTDQHLNLVPMRSRSCGNHHRTMALAQSVWTKNTLLGPLSGRLRLCYAPSCKPWPWLMQNDQAGPTKGLMTVLIFDCSQQSNRIVQSHNSDRDAGSQGLLGSSRSVKETALVPGLITHGTLQRPLM